MKIGIIKESKTPIDRRVALSPNQCREFRDRFAKAKICVQPSAIRCYMDEEYEEHGIQLKPDLSDCDILIGIKEVDPEELIEGKTYLFFSHVIKKQEQNKKLLQAVLNKKIRLIDYELIKDKNGNRLIGFGRFAGIVGAYNGIRAYYIRNNKVELKPAHTLKNFKKLLKIMEELTLPPIKILVAGKGRVGRGVVEFLKEIGVKEIDKELYLSNTIHDEPVFLNIDADEYYERLDGKPFDFQHYYTYPEQYKSTFQIYGSKTDVFMMAAFWDTKSPRLLEAEDYLKEDFSIKVIADISCDIKGALYSTLRASTIEDPFYGYNPTTEQEELAFEGDQNISVMSVDRLPSELSRDSSKSFGNELLENVIPELMSGDQNGIIEKATIAEDGDLMPDYKYLKSWLLE